MSDSMRTRFHEIEQVEGPPLVEPVDPGAIDRHRRMTYRSYEQFLRVRLAGMERDRHMQWRRDYRSVAAYLRSVKPMRQRLKQMLGFWIEPGDRLPRETGKAQILLRTNDFVARRFRFEFLPGIETYAVELVPHSNGSGAGLLIQHGYGGTPEFACGFTTSANLGDYSYRSLGIRAVRRGYHVVAVHHPSGYGCNDETIGSIPGFEQYGGTYGKNRLHRMAIMAGGTLFGLDMMASSRGIDLLLQRGDVSKNRIAMYGKSQGGQSALYLPAMDTRIAASICCAHFNRRFQKLIGPHRALNYLDSPEEDKFFADVIRCFSDCDMVSLIAPRAFAVEAGLKDTSVDFEKSRAEFARAKLHYQRLGIAGRIEFIAHRAGHMSATRRAFEFLEKALNLHNGDTYE